LPTFSVWYHTGHRMHEFFDRHGHELTGAGVWTLGGEPNTDDPADFAAAPLRVLVARASSYRAVAPSTSHGVAASLFRRHGRAFCDFAYLPPPKDRPVLTAAAVPWWFGTTTKRPPRDFDVLAVSLSTALEFVNLPALLGRSFLPLGRSERLASPDLPLVLAGGAASGHVSAIVGEPCLVDAVCVGDGEASLAVLVPLLVRWRREGWTKERLLAEATLAVPGFYDPARFVHEYDGTPPRLASIRPDEPVRRAVVVDPSAEPEPVDLPVPYDDEGLGTARIRISLGCAHACAFCQEGCEGKPYRPRTVPFLRAAFRAAKASLGADRVDAYALDPSGHPALEAVLGEAARIFATVTVKSERLDGLVRNPASWLLQRRLGKRTLTCGIEGLSERLRRRLGKGLPTAVLERGLALLADPPPGSLKLFFILTGDEQDDDLAEFRDLCRGWARRVADHRLRTRTVLSFTPLHAAAHTPLGRHQTVPVPALLERLRRKVEAVGRETGLEVRFAEEPWAATAASLLAAGDRRLTGPLVRAFGDGRGMYDDGLTRAAVDGLHDELARDGLTPDCFLYDRPPGAPAPWDDVVVGASAPAVPRGDGAAPPAESLSAAKDAEPLFVQIFRRPRFRLVPAAFWPVVTARALMLAVPSFVDDYVGPSPEPLLAPPPDTAGLWWVTLRCRAGLRDRTTFDEAAAALHLAPWAELVTVTTEAPAPPSVTTLHLSLPSVDHDDLARALQAGDGRAPLPLTVRRTADGLLLEATGARAKRCPVLRAELRTDGAVIAVRAGFDLAALLRRLYGDDEAARRGAVVTVKG